MKGISILSLFFSLLLFLSCEQHNGKIPADKKRITLSGFTKGENYQLVDTINAASLNSYLSIERTLSADSAAILENLLTDIKMNGTDDITKCFIPRHSINFYEGDKVEKFVLVCFECEGIRFSDANGPSPVKDVNKRIEQVNDLKKYFSIE